MKMKGRVTETRVEKKTQKKRTKTKVVMLVLQLAASSAHLTTKQ
jgi:hypothetical protein